MSKIDDATQSHADTEAAMTTVLARLADGNVPCQAFDTADGRTFVVSRNDFKVENVTPANKAEVFMPKNIKASPKVQNAISLIEYLNRFKNDDSVVFADIKTDTLVGVIDHHLGTGSSREAIAEAASGARLGDHSVTLALPKSEEWAKWTGQNERLMSHTDFASFLEENAFDVVSPAGADLLELCRDLQVKQDMNFSSSIRMGDAVSISYQKDEDAVTKQNMSLPVSFMIEIPVYFGEGPVALTCYMRRKISDGKLHLGYKIIRLEATRQKEFARVVTEVEVSTGLTTIYGTRG